jgi:hypothetical protein
MTAWLSEFSAYLSSDQRVKERAVQQYAYPFREHLGTFKVLIHIIWTLIL